MSVVLLYWFGQFCHYSNFLLLLFLLFLFHVICVRVVPSKFLPIAGSTKLVAPSPLAHPTPAPAAVAAFVAECIQDCHTKA